MRSRSRRVRPGRNGTFDRRGITAGRRDFEHERANRVFDERLLTIEWERGELPEVPQIDAGSWLLLSASKLIR